MVHPCRDAVCRKINRIGSAGGARKRDTRRDTTKDTAFLYALNWDAPITADAPITGDASTTANLDWDLVGLGAVYACRTTPRSTRWKNVRGRGDCPSLVRVEALQLPLGHEGGAAEPHGAPPYPGGRPHVGHRHGAMSTCTRG